MKIFFKLLLSLLLFAASTALGLLAGYYGAKIGGMAEGGWNFQFLLPMTGGLKISAFVSFLFVMCVMNEEKILGKTLLGFISIPPGCSLLWGIGCGIVSRFMH